MHSSYAIQIADRKKYIALVDGVKANGGEVYLFSSMHFAGQQLDNMSGIAAVLRYQIPETDEMDQAGRRGGAERRRSEAGRRRELHLIRPRANCPPLGVLSLLLTLHRSSPLFPSFLPFATLSNLPRLR